MTQRKINIKQARKILGKAATHHNDQELAEVLKGLYGLCDLAFDQWLDEESPKD